MKAGLTATLSAISCECNYNYVQLSSHQSSQVQISSVQSMSSLISVLNLGLGKKWPMRGERRSQERRTMEKGKIHLDRISNGGRETGMMEPTMLSGRSWCKGNKRPRRPEQYI